MRVGRHGLAVSTEVRVMAHSTLVTRSSDVVWRRLVLAERTITEDAIVDFLLLKGLSDGTVNRSKPMAWVGLRCVRNTVRAVIPVGAGQALVTYTNDAL